MIDDPIQLAWAAGFFEGEGNIYVPPPRTAGHGLRLTVYQSCDGGEPPELQRFARVVGCGKITPRPASPLPCESQKQRWMWRVQRRESAERVLAALAPFMTKDPALDVEAMRSARSVEVVAT